MANARAAQTGQVPSTLRTTYTPYQLQIFRKGLQTPVLTQHARADQRPYIHPILAPDGVGEVTEDGAGGHHDWQHGLFVGLNAVNGVRFWMEEAGVDGTIHPRPLIAPVLAGNAAKWSVHSEWRSLDGLPMLLERQEWLFRDEGAVFILDLSWTLQGLVDIIFGQYAYGGLYLRSPFRPHAGALVMNSEGDLNLAVDGRRARWVAVAQPILGREQRRERICTIAMLDHPSNPEHPVPWRTDHHAGLSPSRCIAGAWHLGRGETARSRYRLLIRYGKMDEDRIEADWRAFVEK